MSTSTNNNQVEIISVLKGKKTKSVKYPKMMECARQFPEGDYWFCMFKDLAYGITPKRIAIDDNNIFCNKKQSMIFRYSHIPVAQAAVEIKEFIIKHSHSFSVKDTQEEEKKIEQMQESYKSTLAENKFNKIKLRKTREFLILKFVSRKRTELNMSRVMGESLYQVIIDSLFTYKTHKPIDFIMKDGEIDEILDIQVHPPSNLRFGKIEEKVTTVPKLDLCHEWNKYIMSLYKKASSYQVDKYYIINDVSESTDRAQNEDTVMQEEQEDEEEQDEEECDDDDN